MIFASHHLRGLSGPWVASAGFSLGVQLNHSIPSRWSHRFSFADAMKMPGAGVNKIAGPVKCAGVDLYLGWVADQPNTLM